VRNLETIAIAVMLGQTGERDMDIDLHEKDSITPFSFSTPKLNRFAGNITSGRLRRFSRKIVRMRDF
jgi:hypothetical protein